jgi:glycosyltransferase involved in cell wall biosynthesis
MMNSVTVLTITRERPELLKRAIASVRAQDYPGQVVHLIMVDDCDQTVQALAKMESSAHRKLVSHFESRGAGDRNGRARSAYLRNLSVGMTDSRWVAFLDDDNEYESNHLSSLITCAVQNKHSAVHSYRKIYHADGSPYLERRFPWVRDVEEGKRLYEYYCDRGLLIRDTNIFQDRADPKGQPDGIRMVDSSVWLFERSLLIRYPFPQQYTEKDIRNNVYEDDKLLDLLQEHEVSITTTGQPTVKYYLGGYSNTFSTDEI